MGAYTKIWSLASAGIRQRNITEAASFALSNGLDNTEPSAQRDLSLWDACFAEDSPLPLLCLRCRMSEPLHMWLLALVRQFNAQHDISAEAVAAYVLNDYGKLEITTPGSTRAEVKVPFTLSRIQTCQENELHPFSAEVLRNWDPKKSTIATWARTRAQAHNPLKRYLKECGVLLISDWALLADTSPTRIQDVFVLMKERTNLSVEQIVEMHNRYVEHYRDAKNLYRKKTGKNVGWLPDEGFLKKIDQSRTPSDTYATLRDLAYAIRQLLTGSWKWNINENIEQLSDQRQGLSYISEDENLTTDTDNSSGIEDRIENALQVAMEELLNLEMAKERTRFESSPDKRLAWILYGEGLSQRLIAERCGHQQGWVSKLIDEKRRAGTIATAAAYQLIRLKQFSAYREKPEAAEQLQSYLRNRLIQPEQEEETSPLRNWIHRYLKQP